jgi:hypothetical protein
LAVKKTLIAISVFLLALPVIAIDAGSFDAFYEAPGGIGFWGWTIIVVTVIAAAAFAYFTGGAGAAAAPAWIKAVGTWVGSTVYGLHGIAATNAGLALLGGGSIAAGGLGIKGGVVLLTILASTSSEIAIEYSVNEAVNHFSNKAFIEDSKKMSTLPLPINDDGSDSYKKCLEWLLAEKKMQFDDKKVEFNIHDAKYQDILKEATLIFGRDLLNEDDDEDKINGLTFLSLLYFQRGYYRDAFKYSYDVVNYAKQEKSLASLACCIYATSYLYSESAQDNLKVQNEYLVPALIEEGSNKCTPLVLTVYLDRLMYRIHHGKSKTTDLQFAITLLKNKKFSKNAIKCLPIFTVRIIQELKRSQKDIEVLAKCKSKAFLRGENVSNVVDIRFRNFVGLRDIIKTIIPFVRMYEKDFDKDYPFTSTNLEAQLNGFYETEPKLQASIKELKRLINESDTVADQESEFRWWKPQTWF